MCGIAGLLLKDRFVVEKDLVNMSNQLAHRGPDGSGAFLYEHIGFAHRRLSIIDLEGGKQPLSNTEGTLWITFNGEIYNYLELRKDLIGLGYHFKTQSDTEVVVHCYEEWGPACVERLRGMFAFAVLDIKNKELFLARDHFGIKPLIYAASESAFCFASELQALKEVSDLKLSIDTEALNLYLQLQYIPAPFTIYKEAKKLPPAHWMRVGFNGAILEMRRYWKWSFHESEAKTEAEWMEGLEAVIKESVNAHLVSDVPFGAFLSGGIDSSVIVSYMAQHMQVPVKTFSIGFENEDFNELQYAETVAKRWGTEHFTEVVEPDALGILPQLVRHYGEPFGDSSAIPTWYVSRLARRHVTMVLTGDAGDELLAGYRSYTEKWSRYVQPVPEHLSGFKKCLYPYLNIVYPLKFPLRAASPENWLRIVQYFSAAERAGLWKKEIAEHLTEQGDLMVRELFQEAASYRHFQKAQYVDFNSYLPGDVLTKVDIASMMHSLETRTPLLDIKVAAFASSIPQSILIGKKVKHWHGKMLLKKLLGGYFSEDFIYRPKMGFAVPVSDWFGKNGKSRNEIRERILDRQVGFSDLFNRKALEDIAEGEHAGHQWLLIFLQEWLSQTQRN
ncbi:MAG TPA: asparagine synthase (glutamine-hydrolyzing) [Saprospiraceae bacterium]|nr:asparagine synthase (glutamine-hydrolyzing) [Lacibacter sp.]HMO89988.1 asparagine synthase (glutamine-hydrolyzing) [Lacibacter sp.]HMQ08613.1 asparagine synthase (glutamine-hydrolyzing) [Saprospiraceae bacterium]